MQACNEIKSQKNKNIKIPLNVKLSTLASRNLPIFDERFLVNKALLKAMDHVKEKSTNLHLIGLIGPGHVHSSQKHLHALLRMAHKQKVKNN